nr:IS630 family transposase [Ktedonobacter sp. SOSP1-85]
MKKHIIRLQREQHQTLEALINCGQSSARRIKHAQILLKSEQGWRDKQIMEAFGVGETTIWRVRRRYLEKGLDQALHRRPQPERPEKRKLSGEAETHLIALACTQAPSGYERWSIRLLTKTAIELEVVSQVGRETVRQVPKKNVLKPWLKKQWCIPPEQNAECVYHMEDVLEVYQRPYDPKRPQVCMDEASKQLLADTRERLPLQKGKPERYDYEYEREGTANLFIATEPLTGRRVVAVTERRTRVDWAHFVRDLIEVQYPDAEKIVFVMDNLNTHTPASLYEAFPAQEARRLAEKVEIHWTPKHGSWLNMAEIELSVLARQCLGERIAGKQELCQRVSAWQDQRNQAQMKINWRFTTADARIKLKRLYPSFD